VLAADPANEVRLLTRQPGRWSTKIRAIYRDIAEVSGLLEVVTDDVCTAVRGAGTILVCTPLQTRAELLRRIGPELSPGAWVGGIPGFGGFERDAASLPEHARVFGLQRVPYVRKTISYGEAVWLSGIRPRLFVGTLPSASASEAAALVEELLGIPTTPLSTYSAVALSASNAIFHPARLVTCFPAPEFRAAPMRGFQFYEDWDDDASIAYLALDADVQAIASGLAVPPGEAVPIPEHFGISNSGQLTTRIQTIRALRDRSLPMRGAERRLDMESHYLTEDAWFALPALQRLGREARVPTPAIDQAVGWAEAARDLCLAGADRQIDPIPVHSTVVGTTSSD
jgi:hypothetical protein